MTAKQVALWNQLVNCVGMALRGNSEEIIKSHRDFIYSHDVGGGSFNHVCHQLHVNAGVLRFRISQIIGGHKPLPKCMDQLLRDSMIEA